MKTLPPTGRLNSMVHEALRAAIISGELRAGGLYSVNDLALQLGVSRTPVREAVIRLASLGMVRFERNRGVRILETSWTDLQEIFTLRLLLEVPAARRAVTRIRDDEVRLLRSRHEAMHAAALAGDEEDVMRCDRAFHAGLLAAAGNVRLVDYVDDLRDMVLGRGKSTAGHSRGLLDIVEEHRAVLERVEARDADGAAAQLRRHLLHTARLLVGQEPDCPDRGRDLDLGWTSTAADDDED